MKKLYQLFSVLDKWKSYYILAGVFLTLSSIIRMLEPKILQIAIDGVILFFRGTSQIAGTDTDPIVRFFYLFLPEFRLDNLFGALFSVAMLFLVIAALQALSRFTAAVISASCTENAIKRLRDVLFSHIQALPLVEFSRIPSGEMIQRCTGDIDTVRNFIGSQVTEMIRLVSVFFGAFIMMFVVHKVYAVIAVVLVPFIALTAFLFYRKESKVWEEHEAEQDKLTAIIQENLNGIRVVQAFAKEDFEIEKFNKQNKVKLNVGIKHVDLHMFFWPFSDFLVNLQVALSLLAGGYFALQQQITIGEFTSFFTYSIMVTWPMRAVGRIVSQMGMAAVAMDRITQILDAPQEEYEGYIPENGKLEGNVEFKDVVFGYDSNETKTLNGVSFKVNAGERVALMGPAGAGKSTIMALLSRFYEPDSGEILLDGRPLNTYDKSFLRSRFGVVHQKPFLFSTTLKENIAYTNPDAREEAILKVADAAAITSFIDKMSNGYETLVGEKGVTLSGGQKQRVALARTLLSNPDILVLDDSTSAVDTETEYAIQNALNQTLKGKTTFVIAHRLTSVQDANKIIIMEKGKIVEQGTHEQLLLNAGFYKMVYDIQVSIEDDIEREILS